MSSPFTSFSTSIHFPPVGYSSMFKHKPLFPEKSLFTTGPKLNYRVSLSSNADKSIALDFDVGRILAKSAFNEKTEFLRILKRDSRIRTLSDLNSILSGLLEAKETDLALKIYTDALSHGFEPDSRIYSIIINCHCKKNNVGEAKRVLDNMLQKGNSPNVSTFTTLINSLCKCGKLKQAFEVLEVMHRIGTKPTVKTYNCLLKGLCYIGKVEKAYEMLNGLAESDIYSYTAVMEGFCKVGRTDEAMELLEEVLQIGMEPNPVTFNALFTGYSKEGKPEKGFQVLKLMKETNCVPDSINYCSLLSGLMKWGKTRAGLKVYNEMVYLGYELDEKMMNSLVKGLCMKSWVEKDLVRDAYQVFDEMRKRVSVDSVTYGLVIRSLCVGMRAEEALEHLRRLIGTGCIPRTITFNNVIQAFCAEGKVGEAFVVLVLMSEHGKIPSRTSYDMLVRELTRQGRSLSACNVYGAALKQGVFPHKLPQK